MSLARKDTSSQQGVNKEKSIENLESWYNKRKNDLEQEYYKKSRNLEREHAEKRKNLDTGYDLKKRSLNLEISTLSEEREELQRNCDLLTETKMQHSEAFEFVAYTVYFLADRENVPTKTFETLILTLNSIVERRRKGLITDWEEKKARTTILKGLMDYTDAVSKSEYDKIKEENDILTSPDPDRARFHKQMRRYHR